MTDLVALDIGGTHARFALARIASDGTIARIRHCRIHRSSIDRYLKRLP